jgi:hypothetical protein
MYNRLYIAAYVFIWDMDCKKALKSGIITVTLLIAATLATQQLEVQAQQVVEMPRLPNLIDGDNWDPPETSEGIIDKCIEQAESNDVEAERYCIMMSGFCLQFSLTINECYAYNFAEPEVTPQQVLDGILEKVYNH